MKPRTIYRLVGKGIIFSLLVLINCKDPINLPGEGSIGILVIDGKVTTQPGPYYVRLGYTVGLSQKPSPILLATVFLVDDDTGLTEQYLESEPGVYSVPGSTIQGTAGHSYHVAVTLPNGKSYASKSEKIPDATGIDVSSYDFGTRSDFIGETEVQKNVINIYTDTQLPAGENDSYYLRWNVSETYVFEQTPIPNPLTGGIPRPCYVDGYSDPQRITLFTTQNQELQSLKHTLVAQRDLDYTFLARHYFTIYLSSTTLESYKYFKNVNELINRSGSIFDTPPAPIIGNVYSVTDSEEKVFGYFEATNTSLTRFFTLRGNIPVSLAPYCNDPSVGIYWPGYPKECHFCLGLSNSSDVPPNWWPTD